jgi:hypothetical protein
MMLALRGFAEKNSMSTITSPTAPPALPSITPAVPTIVTAPVSVTSWIDRLRTWLEQNQVFLNALLIPLLTVLGVALAFVQVRDARRIADLQDQQQTEESRQRRVEADMLGQLKELMGRNVEQTALLAKLQKNQEMLAARIATDTIEIAQHSKIARPLAFRVWYVNRSRSGFRMERSTNTAEVVEARVRVFRSCHAKDGDGANRCYWELDDEGSKTANVEINKWAKACIECSWDWFSVQGRLVQVEVRYRIDQRDDRWVCLKLLVPKSPKDHEEIIVDDLEECRFDQGGFKLIESDRRLFAAKGAKE